MVLDLVPMYSAVLALLPFSSFPRSRILNNAYVRLCANPSTAKSTLAPRQWVSRDSSVALSYYQCIHKIILNRSYIPKYRGRIMKYHYYFLATAPRGQVPRISPTPAHKQCSPDGTHCLDFLSAPTLLFGGRVQCTVISDIPT